MLDIELYETIDGKCPVAEFLKDLDPKMNAKIWKIIEMLEKDGVHLRMPYSKYLRDGIFELRISQGSNISRILFFFFDGNKAILTNGFIKKSEKTPETEILLAKKYRDDYKRRNYI